MHEKHLEPAISEPEEKKTGAVRGHGMYCLDLKREKAMDLSLGEQKCQHA